MAKVSFERFSELNKLRCESPDGFNHELRAWDVNKWMVALFGEIGEAANIIKKLNRWEDDAETGKRVNNEEAYILQEKLKRELGDAFVYLDLIAQHLGFNIFEAAIEVFNRKSRELGCNIVITEPDM